MPRAKKKEAEAPAEAVTETVQRMPLSQLHPFEGHPFKVLDDDAMTETVESIRQMGVANPLIVRPDQDGGYEIISGHRRHHAAELAGLDTIPVIVRELDDDAAVIMMVDSNLQRENILPSERAKAYKMKLEALKHQGSRTDLTCEQDAHKLGREKIQGHHRGTSRYEQGLCAPLYPPDRTDPRNPGYGGREENLHDARRGAVLPEAGGTAELPGGDGLRPGRTLCVAGPAHEEKEPGERLHPGRYVQHHGRGEEGRPGADRFQDQRPPEVLPQVLHAQADERYHPPPAGAVAEAAAAGPAAVTRSLLRGAFFMKKRSFTLMNSIHFHFNGDVNINLSLPDSADRPGYKKLVDSLEDYLHDAAEEAAVTEAEADSIVMVMRPDKTPEVMQETQCWDEIESKGKYDCLEVVSDDALDVAGLAIVFDGRRVLNLGRERYLLGPVIVYKTDEDGDGVSLSAEDVIAAVVYFADHTVTLYADGKDFPAFHI